MMDMKADDMEIQKRESDDGAAASREWLRRFVDAQVKELAHERLAPAEERILVQAELIGRALPGVLNEMLLAEALCGVGSEPLRVAAASPSDRGYLYDLASPALQAGQEVLKVDIAGRERSVLRLHTQEDLVEPCYQSDLTFTVERRGQTILTVGPYGGVFLALADLKGFRLTYDTACQTLRLVES